MTGMFDVLLGVGAILAVLGAAAFIYQITQRQRVFRDLQALSQDMLLAEDVARIGYWNMDFPTNRVTWSAGMYHLFEQDRAYFQPTAENVGPLFMPQYLPGVRALTDPESTGGRGGEVEARIVCPDGDIKDVLVATRFRRAKGVKVTGVFGIVADITARKVAQRTRAEREEQLQRAISAMGAGIWDWDIGTDRLFAGPRFAEILVT
jgi:PAS domain-containing protein